jgi:hypothetical protein
MEIWSPQEWSSIWKFLKTGSGVQKNGNVHFCHLRACSGNDIVRYSVEENRYVHRLYLFVPFIVILINFYSFLFTFYCDFCKQNDKQRCYHWSVGDEHSINIFRRQLKEHLHLYLSAQGRHYEEVKHLFWCNGCRDAGCIFFSNLLTFELHLQRLPVIGSIEERQAHLNELLKVEQQLDIISQAISRGEEGKEAALMLISQATPCIMHLENRVGGKIIMVLLAMAADNF